MGYEVDFMPVGEGEKSGDAIALRFGNLHGQREEQVVVVIDGGFEDSGKKMVAHIKSHYNTDYVDVAVSTHPDADHASGLEVVLEELRVGQLWMHLPWNHTDDIAKMFKHGRVTDDSVEEALRKSLDNARSLEELAKAKKIPIVEPFTGVHAANQRIVVVGPTVPYYESLLPNYRGTPAPKEQYSMLEKALQGAKEFVKKIAESWDIETLDDEGETSAENNSSVILLIAPDDKNVLLFTGDAGIPALTIAADLLNNAEIDHSKISFIQVPHHGSKRNVGPSILNRLVGPKQREDKKVKTAFVSVAVDGEPKHPSKKVTNAFKRRGAHVYWTKGSALRHHHDAPSRNWQTAEALPFYPVVEE